MSKGPIYVQHKARQQNQLNQMQRRPSAFSPLDITNGPWSKGLGVAVPIILAAAGGVIGELGAIEAAGGGAGGEVAAGLWKTAAGRAGGAGGTLVGSTAGKKIGFYIDNAHSIVTNVLTLLANPIKSFGDLDSENFESDMFGQ